MKADGEILLIAYDRLGTLAAGPSIRTIALATELSKVSGVQVLYSGDENYSLSPIEFIKENSIDLDEKFFSRFRMALVPPLFAMQYPALLESNLPLVVDLFDPVIWENLELYKGLNINERKFQHERHLAAMLSAMMRGDFFLAAGRRQVDLFTGALMALNRINPDTWDSGRGPEQLVGYVPFGVTPLDENKKYEIPGEYKNLGSKKLIVWGGGMWDWLNPVLVVEKMQEILEKIPDAHLIFPGTVHPNPHVPEMENVSKAKARVKELGIEASVSFGKWLSRDDYLGLLSSASCGVSAHKSGYESHYAVRTRFMDAFACSLPMVVTGGDEYSAIISEYKIGEVIESDRQSEFADAVVKVINSGREGMADGFRRVVRDFSWSEVSKPLNEYAKKPKVCHGAGSELFTEMIGVPSARSKPHDFRTLMDKLIRKLR